MLLKTGRSLFSLNIIIIHGFEVADLKKSGIFDVMVDIDGEVACLKFHKFLYLKSVILKLHQILYKLRILLTF